MTPIPTKLRKQMSEDPWYTRCCRCGDPRRVEWHHTIIYASKQVQEAWAIVPACEDCHKKVNEDKNVKDYFIHVSLNRAMDSELQRISKVINYFRLRKQLNQKYAPNK